MPVRFLWSIDPETGERLPVTGDGVRLSSAWIRASSSGRVVVVGFCEEYVQSVTVFDVQSSSDLIDGVPVTAIPTEFVRRVTWAGEDLLIASEHPSAGYTGELDLTLVNVDTGQSEFLLTLPPESPAEALTERGHLATIEGDAVVVRTRSLEIVAEYPGSDFAVSADGSLVAVVDGHTVSVGPVGGTLTALLVVPDDGSAGRSMLREPVWSADGQSLAFVRQLTHEGDSEVVVVELSGRIVVAGSGNVVLSPLFLPGAVVFTQCGTEGCQIMITDLNS